MSDLIDREKAIEDLQNGDPSELYDIEDIKYWLNSLPSAEPKTPSNGSITCVKSEKMYDRTTDGLIRRQDAKDAIDMALDHIDHVPPWVYDKLLNALNEVPSAEKAQLSGEDATSVCKCPCVYREPCDYCYYDAYRGHGCPAEEGVKDE